MGRHIEPAEGQGTGDQRPRGIECQRQRASGLVAVHREPAAAHRQVAPRPIELTTGGKILEAVAGWPDVAELARQRADIGDLDVRRGLGQCNPAVDLEPSVDRCLKVGSLDADLEQGGSNASPIRPRAKRDIKANGLATEGRGAFQTGR